MIHVERYRICNRCSEKTPVHDSVDNRLSMSYHGMVGNIYHRNCDVHLCEMCSEEFVQWMKGVGE